MTAKQTNALDAYRVPDEVLDGTWLDIPNTPVRALVRLPCSFNEEYQIAWFLRLDSVPTEDAADRNPAEMIKMKTAMREAFVEVCIVGIEGLPEGMDLSEFARVYRPAIDALQNVASKLGTALDERVAAALKNSTAFSNGHASGKAKSKHTTRSKKQAKPSTATAPH